MLARGRDLCDHAEVLLQLCDPCFEQSDFLDQELQAFAQHLRYCGGRIGQDPGHLLQAHPRCFTDQDTKLPATVAQGIDPGGTRGHTDRADPVQAL